MDVVRLEVNKYLTRATGRNAARTLFDSISNDNCFMHPGGLLIDFTGIDMITASFMDELVLKLKSIDVVNDTLVFRLSSKRQVEWLEDVSGLRNIVIHYQLGDSDPVSETRRRKAEAIKAETIPGGLFHNTL